MDKITKESTKSAYYFILFGLILANILVYVYNISSIFVLLVISFVAFCKAFISEEFLDIYNIHSFKFTLTSNNILELVGAFLVGTIVSKSDIIAHDFDIGTISFFIVAVVVIYRFLFFDLSIGTSNRENN